VLNRRRLHPQPWLARHKPRRAFALANLRFVGALIGRSPNSLEMKKTLSTGLTGGSGRPNGAPLFDIVNGFFNRCRGDADRFGRSSDRQERLCRTQINLAEI